MRFVMGICDRVHVLDFGKLIASGHPAEVQARPSSRPISASATAAKATVTPLPSSTTSTRYGRRGRCTASRCARRGPRAWRLGANGAGKTTTLRAHLGLVRKTGHISFAGRSIARKSPEAVARLGVAHVPQGRGIIGDLSSRTTSGSAPTRAATGRR